MLQNQQQQRLFWSLSRPLRWVGLTIDEWACFLGGLVSGILLLNGDDAILGIICIILGTFLCYALKKFKKLSEHFLLKSWLLSKGLVSPPSKNYPNMLNQRVGK